MGRNNSIILVTEILISQTAFFAFLSVVSLLLTYTFSLSASDAGFVLLVASIVSKVIRVAISPFLHHVTYKLVMVLSHFLALLGVMLLYNQSITVVTLGIILILTANGIHNVVINTLIALEMDSTSKRMSAFAYLNLIVSIAAGVGPFIAMKLFASHHLTHLVSVYLLLVISSMMLCVFIVIRNPRAYKDSRGDLKNVVAKILDSKIVVIFALTILTWGIYIQYYVSLPLLFSKEIKLASILPYIFLINALTVVTLTPVVTKLVSGREKIILIIGPIFAYMVLGVSFLALAFAEDIFIVCFVLVLISASEILILPMLSTRLANSDKGERTMQILFSINAVSIGLGEGGGSFFGVYLAMTDFVLLCLMVTAMCGVCSLLIITLDKLTIKEQVNESIV